MRKPIIAGNWKMFKTEAEAVDFVRQLKPKVAEMRDRTIVVCPPFPVLSKVWDEICNDSIALGAQDLFWEEEGAYTGEVSAPMLKAVGCTYVIIGHSERRQYFGETDESVNKKLCAALKHRLIPIVCVGERLEEREKGTTFKVVETQIKGALKNIAVDQCKCLVIAYEPVWAIGTGKAATGRQANGTIGFIRQSLAELYSKTESQEIRILYGGSVTADNVAEFMKQPEIDGALVGGASLQADQFLSITKQASEIKGTLKT